MATRTKIIYLFLGLAVGFAAGFPLGRGSAPDAASWSRTFGMELEGRPLRGSLDAPVTIIEFTDYECPFCRRYFETTYPLLLQRYGDRVSYTVRHFPVSYQHRRARKAAEAAECAGDQGRFFEYHDVLFKNSRALDDRSLVGYAAQTGLDSNRFQTCLESGTKSEVVDEDIQAGIARGIMGTPTFLINGRIIVGAQPVEMFQREIERELAAE
ncbi:MAG: thioredoxin domain-containing protein [Gemmatimonadota bacterium]|nr:MAG: thioredoxin domain-containing protein [Gemmatimonadota bacterium]